MIKVGNLMGLKGNFTFDFLIHILHRERIIHNSFSMIFYNLNWSIEIIISWVNQLELPNSFKWVVIFIQLHSAYYYICTSRNRWALVFSIFFVLFCFGLTIFERLFACRRTYFEAMQNKQNPKAGHFCKGCNLVLMGGWYLRMAEAVEACMSSCTQPERPHRPYWQ